MKISSLIAKLDTSSDKKAEKVIVQLSKLGKRAVPDLMKAAQKDPSPKIRKWSLQALGAMGDLRAAPLLVKALSDEKMTVKLHALKGLEKMKYKKAAKKIAALLNDESGGIRVNAIYALISLKDASVAAAVQKSLNDKQWYVRQIACKACGALNITKAKAKLKALAIKDERKAVRTAAAEVIKIWEARGNH